MNKTLAGKGSSTPYWWSLSLILVPVYYEEVTRLLFAAGCSGVWEGERGDDRLSIVAYFPAEGHSAITDLCQQLSPLLSDPESITIEKIGQQNWMEGWKEHFKPVDLTPSWVVLPPWWPEAGTLSDQILIYPGMAFGTGTHETTRLAAMLLEKVLQPGDAVLDVGTGSAILAILAHKLRAGQVLAYDVDIDALENAAENCRLNNCDRDIRLSSDSLVKLEEKFDLVVANIVVSVLVELAPLLVEKVNPGGQLILSGILVEQLPMLRDVYVNYGCTVEQLLAEGEWVALRCRP